MRNRVAVPILLAASAGMLWAASRLGASSSSSADAPGLELEDDTANGGTMRDVALIVIHHTAAAESAWGWDDIRADHIENNGWTDIGYHYGVSKNGTLETGRAESKVGAHAYGNNSNSIGVVLLGDFHDSGELPTEAQLDTTAELLEELLERYGLELEDVKPHSELGSSSGHTDCPGFDWDWFTDEMKARLGPGAFA